ncbi:uncharacterized protein LOC118549866 [Halichoerus grypus]
MITLREPSPEPCGALHCKKKISVSTGETNSSVSRCQEKAANKVNSQPRSVCWRFTWKPAHRCRAAGFITRVKEENAFGFTHEPERKWDQRILHLTVFKSMLMTFHFMTCEYMGMKIAGIASAMHGF